MADEARRREWWFPCIPPTQTAQQNLRVTKGGQVYKARNDGAAGLTALLAAERPDQPMDGPLSVYIGVYYPLLGRHSATRLARERLGLYPTPWCTNLPDLDNFAKGFLDTLVQLRYIVDDRTIVRLCLDKRHSAQPGVALIVQEVED